MELSSVKSDAVSLLSITSETSSLSKHMVNGDNGSFASKTLTRAKKKQFRQLRTHANPKKENGTIFSSCGGGCGYM